MSKPIRRRVYVYNAIVTYQQQVPGTTEYRTANADVPAALNYIKGLPFNSKARPSAYIEEEDDAEELTSVRFFYEEDDFILGQLARKRTNGLPLVEKEGALYPLNIEEGSGIHEAAHFVYIKRDRRLIFENNAYAPKVSTLAAYLVKKLYGDNDIHLDEAFFRPILRGNAIDQFLNQRGSVAELEIEVHKNYIDQVRSLDDELGTALENAKAISVETERVSVIFRRGKGKRRGGIRDIKGRIAPLARRNPEAFEKIKGLVKPDSTDTGRVIPFNLLEDKLVYNLDVKTDAFRHIDSEEMFAEMLRFYDVIRKDLA